MFWSFGVGILCVSHNAPQPSISIHITPYHHDVFMPVSAAAQQVHEDEDHISLVCILGIEYRARLMVGTPRMLTTRSTRCTVVTMNRLKSLHVLLWVPGVPVIVTLC